MTAAELRVRQPFWFESEVSSNKSGTGVGEVEEDGEVGRGVAGKGEVDEDGDEGKRGVLESFALADRDLSSPYLKTDLLRNNRVNLIIEFFSGTAGSVQWANVSAFSQTDTFVVRAFFLYAGTLTFPTTFSP